MLAVLDPPYWACARTFAGREAYVAERLEGTGFATFNPKTLEGVRATSLFRNYLFVQIEDRWRVIERTHGVIGLIKTGDCPARCPDREIEALRKRIDADGLVRLANPPRPRLTAGTKVKVGLVAGVYVGQTPRERQRVLIQFLGRQLEVQLRPGSAQLLANL